MHIQTAIAKLLERKDLDGEEMTAAMEAIMTGEATPAQIGGFLVGLRMKGETVTEIAAAAGVMRELATGVDISGLEHAEEGEVTRGQILFEGQRIEQMDPTEIVRLGIVQVVEGRKVLELINEAKAAGSALIGIFHDRAAREAVADRFLDMTPDAATQQEYVYAS